MPVPTNARAIFVITFEKHYITVLEGTFENRYNSAGVIIPRSAAWNFPTITRPVARSSRNR